MRFNASSGNLPCSLFELSCWQMKVLLLLDLICIGPQLLLLLLIAVSRH